jgi:hypothetical protein
MDIFRHIKWWWQRRTRGFDDRDLWSLDYTIAKFILPRLKSFKYNTIAYPATPKMMKIQFDRSLSEKEHKKALKEAGIEAEKEWGEALDKMILAFQYIIEDDYFADDHKVRCIDDGLMLFCKNFLNLWD